MALDVVSLPIDPNADPRRPSLDEARAVVEDATAAPLSASDKLASMAQASGDISGAFSEQKLTEIGARVVADYERDLDERKEWEAIARDALAACSQEEQDKAEKNFPWTGASNMRWPILTIAAMQFNARMLPAVIKGDEAVLCKVIGNDNGRPKMGVNPDSGAIQPVPLMDPTTEKAQLDVQGMPQPDWAIPPGAKASRARRVSEYLNTVLFYRMENWEDDTDALLMQLPAVGCVFRKIWSDFAGNPNSATVSALNLVVPQKARNLETALRITERIEDVYPHEIVEKMRAGFYRETYEAVGMPKPGEPIDEKGEDANDGARLLLEQHCLWDFDEDGLVEPYIVTVDHETRTVLRIEPNFGPGDIEWREANDPITQTAIRTAVRIKRRRFYVKYSMFPHPAGKFYDIGLGHLLRKLGATIDTAINQLLDAGTAAAAGGGFIGSGVRLQSRGTGGVIRYAPGEYKTVDIPGDDLRKGIVERTLPQVSSVTFQVLEMVLGAARDIAGIKDVITGEASNQGQVGTTLALIEQGLQVFNSCAKRCYRALKAEFSLLYDIIAAFGRESVAEDYMNVLDDPEADFKKDFGEGDMDIRPVSDPSAITRMQKMAKAQFKLQIMPQIMAVGGDGREVMRSVLEAVDEEDIDKILPPPRVDPQQQAMQMQQVMLNLRKLAADAAKAEAAGDASHAKALRDAVEAAAKKFELTVAAGEHGMQMGAAAAMMEQPDVT